MKKLFPIILLLYPLLSFGQTVIILDSAIASALRTHPQIHFSQQEIKQQKALKGGSFSLQNPDIIMEAPTSSEYRYGFQQSVDFPLVYVQQSRVAKQNVNLAEKNLQVSKTALVRDVKLAYLNLQFAEIMLKQMVYQDSIFSELYSASEKRFVAGDAGLLEKVSAEAQSKEIKNKLEQAKADLQNALIQLQLLMGINTSGVSVSPLQKISPSASAASPDTSSLKNSPLMQYYLQNTLLFRQELKLQRSKWFPSFTIGYLNQSDDNSPTPYAWQFGFSVPLWFWTQNANVKAANYRYQMSLSQFNLASKNISSGYLDAFTDYSKYAGSLSYYENTGLKSAETIISAAKLSYESGEIGYVVYMQSLNQAFDITQNYYETLRNYNQSVVQLNYLNAK